MPEAERPMEPISSGDMRRGYNENLEKEPAMAQSAVPSIRKSPMPHVGFIAAAVIAVAGMLLYNNYRMSREHVTVQTKQPAVPSTSGGAGVTLAPLADTASAPAGGAPTIQETIVADPEPEIFGAQSQAGPARPGKMQIRLAAGLSGRFRYWFVSSSDRAAQMRPLPGPIRNGIIAIPIPAEYNQSGAQLRILNVSQGKVARASVMDITQRIVMVSPNVGPNLLQNADFTQGSRGWTMEATAPGRGAMRILDGLTAPPGVAGRAVHFDVNATAPDGWKVQCYQSGVDLKEGQPYLISCWAKSDRSRPLHVDVILDKPDWRKVGVTASVNLTPQWNKYLFHFRPTRTEPAHSRVSFVLGETVGPVDIAGITLRPSQGPNTSVVSDANTAVTISASDFN
jgi:hypothetical protein